MCLELHSESHIAITQNGRNPFGCDVAHKTVSHTEKVVPWSYHVNTITNMHTIHFLSLNKNAVANNKSHRVNEPLNFDGDVEANADIKCEHTFRARCCVESWNLNGDEHINDYMVRVSECFCYHPEVCPAFNVTRSKFAPLQSIHTSVNVCVCVCVCVKLQHVYEDIASNAKNGFYTHSLRLT